VDEADLASQIAELREARATALRQHVEAVSGKVRARIAQAYAARLRATNAELKARAAARYEITALDQASSSDTKRYELKLSWPLENLGPSLPNLMATIAGNLYELKPVRSLRLLDMTLPPAFAQAYPGPAFGIAGTRKLSGVQRGPLIGTIIKPSVGLSAADTAALVEQLCAAGIDFIKDDELQADGPACPFDERLRLCMQVIRHSWLLQQIRNSQYQSP
jgi:ribulose-bisphosphate carboxylase large chain